MTPNPNIDIERIEHEISMFGETVAEMRQAAAHHLKDIVLLNSYIAGILSDAQEEMRQGDPARKCDIATRWLNKAKYFLAEASHLQREAEVARREGRPTDRSTLRPPEPAGTYQMPRSQPISSEIWSIDVWRCPVCDGTAGMNHLKCESKEERG